MLTYNITVETVGPLYNVPEDEQCILPRATYTTEVDESQTTSEFNDGFPYHNYTATVKVATSVGYGPESNAIIIHTTEAGKT